MSRRRVGRQGLDWDVTTPLERSIKRLVHAPVHTWFAACPPGFEAVLHSEIGAGRIVPGGVEFEGKLEAGYRANLWLRSATRIFLRLSTFKASHPAEFIKHAGRIRWDVFAPAGVHPKAVSHQSRLGPDTLQHLAGDGPGIGEAMLLVRAEDDIVTLSLDTSGENLHRRGYRLATSRAPIRENLAAGILLWAGYTGSEPFLDPMCGSGTFPIEAMLIAENRAPGRYRAFAFQQWPSFREGVWRHLLKQADELVRPAPQPIFARDINGGAIHVTRDNAERAGVSPIIERLDFFKALPPADQGLVVINPPYGKRIAGPDVDLAAYEGWRSVVLSTTERPSTRHLTFPHGGLTVTAYS